MKKVGSHYQGNGSCTFTVWAPEKEQMMLELVHPKEEILPMTKSRSGYFELTLSEIEPGARYFFRPENKHHYPDPASQFQPEGVHGPSEVINHRTYQWQDQTWKGVPFPEVILYELHVGTFTPEGTFEAIIPRLKELKAFGVNAIEIMPIAQFPGGRNWGYDGVFLYAVQNTYGGPEGFKKLVDACHAEGIAVYLDVVYNHVGPEGNYLEEFGPYHTDKYCTPWGGAMNLDGAWSDAVKEFFILNALYWIEEFHVDGLRFDAIHTIFDQSAVNFWQLLHEKVHELELRLGRLVVLIAESDLNDPKVLKSVDTGGWGFTAQWFDDFHHSLYSIIDEKEGLKRYPDFGRMDQLAKAYTDGFVHSGEFNKVRKRRFGASSVSLPGHQFIAFIDNHDQAGNRLLGERLSMLLSADRLKVAAAAMMLSPCVPMLFMGEEYAAQTPFLYFISHSKPELIEMVQKGRKEDFKSFNEGKQQVPPDPQDEKTFQDSVLNWDQRKEGKHQQMLEWYQALIQLRKTQPILQNFSRSSTQVQTIDESGFVLIRQNSSGTHYLTAFFNLSDQQVEAKVPHRCEQWDLLVHSYETRFSESTHEKTFPENVYANTSIQLLPWSVAVYMGESLETN
ncbi:malto-oligosyltrehalose trehalohydrolase [Siphonobacter sp. SORGH_AS_1065]|uniref:malto-oligosyltrehalose trehalohydrolase n=1 Tax=Siphonobacter sp. SORGH_AS_1065 TaxID=3041795 RepID=UPI0027821CE6|nr:malto-oligosyltrehalose trehalohydrolase [Siphonobacter sp. SORGH_AS_1065]MDQ1090310.1 maltooligosyltrehalose trehalohydrolase [Siphonobacter sp. SORGH_AS_1065]